MDHYICIALIAASTVLASLIGLPMFKVLQLSGYRAKGVYAWWKGSGYDVLIRYAALMLFSFITMIVFVGCFSEFEYVRYSAVALHLILCTVFVVSAGRSGSNNVKPTGRAVRAIVLFSIIQTIPAALVAWACYYNVYFQTMLAAVPMLTPLTALLSNAVLTPFEKLNHKRYIKLAKAALAAKQPTVIGITGSYGKTTAKNILRQMLATQLSVYATPGSYNTPMGICSSVNNGLGDERYFIAEMGARYRGDIAQLCDIVSPKYGIITAVGEMHLATFKTAQAVADTKYELAQGLPSDGVLVINGYNEGAAKLKDRTAPCETVITGETDEKGENGENGVRYEDLTIDGNGTAFDLVIDGQAYPIKTKLLGAHIAELVCACAAIALRCGITAENIAKAACELTPVEHRLQLMEGSGVGVAVIDDSYNSNPVGARNALNVLALMRGKKIIITPGFVELGSIEKESNIALGKDIARVCDYAFLVGSRGADIRKGALAAGMQDGVIELFACRDDAVAALGGISGERAVLFENDLPDNIK